LVVEERLLTPEDLYKTIREFHDNREKLEATAKKAASLYIGDAPRRIRGAIESLLR
jgi:UDP-N-acetylglucosamine:LPS N-acetylglucosamine transferase